jgi:hypothetical protein
MGGGNTLYGIWVEVKGAKSHFMASARAEGTAEGWRVGARYVVRGHTTQIVLRTEIQNERKASARSMAICWKE